MHPDAQRDAEAVVKEYRPQILYWSNLLIRPPEEAEEVCQEVCLKVFLHLNTFEGRNGCSLKTWIGRITRNCATMRLRKRVVRQRYHEDWDIEAIDKMTFSSSEMVWQAQNRIFLTELLLFLKERDREAIILHHAYGFSLAEIAEILDTTEPAVKGLLCRAHKHLVQHCSG